MQVFIEQEFRRIYYLGMSRTSRTAVCPLHWNLVFLTKFVFFIPGEKWQTKAMKSVLHISKLTRRRQFFSTCKGTSKNITGEAHCARGQRGQNRLINRAECHSSIFHLGGCTPHMRGGGTGAQHCWNNCIRWWSLHQRDTCKESWDSQEHSGKSWGPSFYLCWW